MKSKKLKYKILFCISIVLVIAWMVVIFKFSSSNGQTSTKTSRGTLEKIIVIFNKNIGKIRLNGIVKKYDVYFRKITHYGIYLLGGVLIFSMYYNLNKLKDGKVKYVKVLSIITGIIYATTDEIHQYFVIGRSGEVADVFLDGIGVVTGVFIIWLFTRHPS